MSACPRCGAPTAGARCAACGEALVFAPPAVHVEMSDAAAGAVPGQGAGWLITVGILQILLGAVWLVVGGIMAVAAESAAFLQKLSVEVGSDSVANVVRVAGIFCALGGIATIVVSAFVISRRRWAWIVSLVFDSLWVLFDLLVLIKNPGAGLVYLAISATLIVFLYVGRESLR